MEETYTIRAIVLNRRAFRENDSRVIVYSREKGKMTLVARGTGFLKSKLSGHIEPFSELDIMVARGRRFDYIAGAKSSNRFGKIQDNFEIICNAGASFAFLNRVLEENEADGELYKIVLEYLQALSNDFDSDFFYVFLSQAFILKIYAKLGFCPELYRCTACKRKIETENNRFDFSAGGIICVSCTNKRGVRISGNVLKILRFIIKADFNSILKLRAEKKDIKEAMKNISLFASYCSP